MSDGKNPVAGPQPPTPELTPQEKEQLADAANIEQQFAATDVIERLPEIMTFFGTPSPGVSFFGSTSFEGRKLNEMLDLLDSANPSDLEGAGNGLKAANTAINKAATELDKLVTTTNWEGEGADEFRRYGREVVKYAWAIGKMANAVGTQMTVASEGLTSVRNSKPPRDDRLVQKDVKAFTVVEQMDDNPEYQKALQVERNRQEAINQMNRLASFYAVSQTTLKDQEIPVPPRAYGAAVPLPSPGFYQEGGAESGVTAASSAARADFVRPAEASVDSRSVPDVDSGVKPPPPVVPRDTQMQIDSVQAPPAPNPAPQVPVTGGGPAPAGGPPSPLPNVLGGPPPLARSVGTSGVPRTGGPGTAGPVGRAGGPGASQQPLGRATGPLGQQPTAAGRAPVGASGQQPPVGRATGVGTPGAGQAGRPGFAGGTGQVPMAGRAASTGQPMVGGRPAAGAPRGTGRADGIVGGTAQQRTTGATNSRIPRGTVIGGAESRTGGQGTARPGQSGVVGGPQSQQARPTGRTTQSRNGVVGAPSTGPSPAKRGQVAGAGSPIVGGKARKPGRPEDREGTTRPDYVTEDEETWANRRRDPVPPVID
ncbi:hypothetical protein [Streptomyces sp. NPDC005805]|uniref:hypothetical protein n=1 Tax=Streptomyces sp. NPDC005805 TaxID=3157068 RepID=UPI0033DE9180